MQELLLNLFSDFGVTATLFIAIILSVIYYIPKVFNAHFAALAKMQDKFSESLEKITEKNRVISDGFLHSIQKLGDEHAEQIKILEKLDKRQDDIYNHIKK